MNSAYVPKALRYAATKVSGHTSNTFRIQPSTGETAGPNSILTFHLPEGILNLKSFKVHLDVLTTSVKLNAATTSTSGGGFVYGKLPDVHSLISNLEVFIGGVAVQTASQEYNSICHMLKIVQCNRDFDSSIGNTLYHSNLTSTDAVDDVSCIFKPEFGFFGQTSASILPTSMTGVITVRLTMAPTSVLAVKQGGIAYGLNFAAVAAANTTLPAASTIAQVKAGAKLVSYSVSSVFATVDSLQMDGLEEMFMSRLQNEPFIPLNFKTYSTYTLTNQTNAYTMKINQSSSSIDKLYIGQRDSNYTETGIRTRATTASNSDAHVPNYFCFKSFNNSDTKRGTMKYFFTCNSVKYPQFDADILHAAEQVRYISDKMDQKSTGNMITSLAHYQKSHCIIPLCLSMTGHGPEVMSGFDSRSSNTSLDFTTLALTMPTAAHAADTADAQITDKVSTFAVVETTSQLRISLGRQLSIAH